MEAAKNSLNEILREIVSHFAPKRAQPPLLNSDTHLVNDVGIDSPRMIDVILEVEDRLKLTLDDEEVQNLRTFGDLVDLVQSRTAETPTKDLS